jgi:molybdenum storage protein
VNPESEKGEYQLTDSPKTNDGRHHVQSMLMRESLLDKDVQKSTETPVYRMLPEAHVIKIGGRSVMDAGRA